MHLLRRMRARLRVIGSQHGAGVPARVSRLGRAEVLLYHAAQAACSQAGRSAGCCNSEPCCRRHAMKTVDTVAEELGLADSWVEQGGALWLPCDKLNPRAVAKALISSEARFIT